MKKARNSDPNPKPEIYLIKGDFRDAQGLMDSVKVALGAMGIHMLEPTVYGASDALVLAVSKEPFTEQQFNDEWQGDLDEVRPAMKVSTTNPEEV